MTDVKPIVLVALGDRKKTPKLFACPTCGNAYSVKSVGLESARDMAANCQSCRPKQYTCDICGCGTSQYWTRCDTCRFAKKLEAAVEIPDDGGPYCDFGGDTYYSDMSEAVDAGLEWVAPCNITYPKIDAYNVLENLLDDMHEDASVDDLVATDAFEAAVAAFNAAQTQQSWFPDEKRKIRVPASGIEARSDETALAGSAEGESPPEGDAQ